MLVRLTSSRLRQHGQAINQRLKLTRGFSMARYPSVEFIPKLQKSELKAKVQPEIKTRQDWISYLQPVLKPLADYAKDEHEILLRFFDCFRFPGFGKPR